MEIANRKSKIVNEEWLPDMDLNHDKQIQSLLCYRYTIGHAEAWCKLKGLLNQSSQQTTVPKGSLTIAHGFNRGLEPNKKYQPRRGDRNSSNVFCRFGTRRVWATHPRLKPWAVLGRASGADSRSTLYASRH